MEDQLCDDQRQKMLQLMATEHSALQAGRTATIFETGGRTTVFLGTPSSTLVALAFVGQISRLGAVFLGSPYTPLPDSAASPASSTRGTDVRQADSNRCLDLVTSELFHR